VTLAADCALDGDGARQHGQLDAAQGEPGFSAIPNLEQPQWRQLLLEQRNEFSDAHASWDRRMEIARQKNRPGDILVLADETPIRALHIEARRRRQRLCSSSSSISWRSSSSTWRWPSTRTTRPAGRRKAVCLGRLGRFEEAREWVRQLTDDYPRDAECWALLGRVEKEMLAGALAPAGADAGRDAGCRQSMRMRRWARPSIPITRLSSPTRRITTRGSTR
jgi:hypothetical protein